MVVFRDLIRYLKARDPGTRLVEYAVFADSLPDGAIKRDMMGLIRRANGLTGHRVLMALKDIEIRRLQAIARYPRSEGGKSAAAEKKRKAADLSERIKTLWSDLKDKPERDRAALIANRTGTKPPTVRAHIRKMGLRKKA